MAIIAYPGSFDPFTAGHEDVLDQALSLDHHVRIIVADNPAKKYAFSLHRRVEMIRAVTKNHANVDVIGCSGTDTVPGIMRQWNCTHVIRGIRNFDDLQYEQQLLAGYRLFHPDIQPIMFLANKADISSTFVKSVAASSPEGLLVLQSEGMVAPYVQYNMAHNIIRDFLHAYADANNGIIVPSIRTGDLFTLAASGYAFNEKLAYHNLTHIASLLLHAGPYISPALLVAILFHDWGYQAGGSTNIQNALFGLSILAADADVEGKEVLAATAKIIQGTDYENELGTSTPYLNPTSLTNEMHLIGPIMQMQDLDHAILTAPPNVYMESYVKSIATEHGLETLKGAPKRLEYLNKWLEQDRIFKYGQRDNFREHLARLNIEAELKSYL